MEFKAIGDFAELVRGNGLPKSVFTDSGIGCIHYGQIYTYYGVWTNETMSFVAPQTAAPLAKVDTGDIVITNTSEIVEDVCKAVAWLGESQIVTGGHATVIKHAQDPKFLSYYFRTPEFFAQKKRHATGTKVIDVSAKNLARIFVPVPPLEVQREIVRGTGQDREIRATIERAINASPSLRNKKDLIEAFVDSVSSKARVDAEWQAFRRCRGSRRTATIRRRSRTFWTSSRRSSSDTSGWRERGDGSARSPGLSSKLEGTDRAAPDRRPY